MKRDIISGKKLRFLSSFSKVGMLGQSVQVVIERLSEKIANVLRSCWSGIARSGAICAAADDGTSGARSGEARLFRR